MINKLAEEIKKWRLSKGFLTPKFSMEISDSKVSEADLLLGKLMLVVTEISEAAEAVRHGDKENFTEEMADAVIRILDITATSEIDLEKAILAKMKINAGRPEKHGKKTNL